MVSSKSPHSAAASSPTFLNSEQEVCRQHFLTFVLVFSLHIHGGKLESSSVSRTEQAEFCTTIHGHGRKEKYKEAGGCSFS